MRMRTIPLLAALVTLSAFGLPAPARAVDGVIEINQASALAGGVTACDTPGFPVSLCASGAYRLTSNLDLAPAAGAAAAILVLALDVSIDLNGMTVGSSNTCSLDPSGWITTCAQSSSLAAIQGNIRTVVSNGRIKGAWGSGIFALDASEVRDVQVTDCGNYGIILGSRSVAVDVEVVGNRTTGLVVGEKSRVSGVVAVNNGEGGIAAGRGSTVEGVVATTNRWTGINVDEGSTLSRFSASSNGLAGVEIVDGGLAESGTIRNNSRFDPNACGLVGIGGAAYRGVVITSSIGGNSASACGMVNLGGNACQGGACPP